MTRTMEQHPVWEELRRAVVDGTRMGMAGALFDDVRADWEAAPVRSATPGADPLATFAVAFRAGMQLSMAAALFDDVRPAFEAATSEPLVAAA